MEIMRFFEKNPLNMGEKSLCLEMNLAAKQKVFSYIS